MYCKVWLCGVAKQKHSDIYEKLCHIRNLAYTWRFVDERTCRKDKAFIIEHARRLWGNMNLFAVANLANKTLKQLN